MDKRYTCKEGAVTSAFAKAFSSADNLADLKGTTALLHKHGVLIGEATLSEGGELLA